MRFVEEGGTSLEKYEELTPDVSTEDSYSEQTVVHVDERSGRNIVPTGVNVLSGLVHTSFEPIPPHELKNVTVPYDQ